MTLLLMMMMPACELLDYTRGGILVGNPGEVSLDTAPSHGVVWESGTMRLKYMMLEDCVGGEPQQVAQRLIVDLLGGNRIELPEGDWCKMIIFPEGPLTWEATTKHGWPMWLEVEVDSLTVTAEWSFATDDASLLFVLGLPDALVVTDLAPEPGESELIIDITHPAYEDFVYALTDSLTLYDVTGLEGEPGPEHVVASASCGDCDDAGECGPCGEAQMSESMSCGGCGGSSYELVEAMFVPLLGLLGWRRRRRRGPRTASKADQPL